MHRAGGGRVAFGDIGNAFVEVVEGAVRPEYGTFRDGAPQRSPRSAAAMVASSRAIASSCGTTRPAFMSARPRSTPSMISASRATYRLMASAARNDLVRWVAAARRLSCSFASGVSRIVKVVLAGIGVSEVDYA